MSNIRSTGVIRRPRKLVATAVATAALTAVALVPTVGTADASVHAPAWKSFTWGTLRSGDCTMFSGARWTVYPDGTAYFRATVTSSDNHDAWLMRVRLKDANGAVLTALRNARIQDPASPTKFVKNLPDHTQRYVWTAKGNFDPGWYDDIRRMSLVNSC
ncbi:DUF6294 family protein [Streptomyces glomeratus]|uniref:DUF6294 domain-containing protein n=1 Tax=Streptomyces glomeratus TaxID=284452 RepID=A0ABP6LPK3_9ACTN|nr:DUF6294 family protein [Streptomyces glomeratus]MCF1511034.1 DUF6294 family protein [Streptomyces glomeratus]